MKVNPDLKEYVETDILPRYDHFDKAHQRDHIETVIRQSAALADILSAKGTEVDRDMVYIIAAFHDLGIVNGRENHHVDSGRILMADPFLKKYFTPEQLVTMKEAVEDHRASSKSAPRSIYGRIVAESDRQIDPRTIVLRTIQYGLQHYPELDKAGHFARAEAHLKEKYGEGGYLKLWFAESDNSRRLAELRTMMADRQALHALMEDIWLHEKEIPGQARNDEGGQARNDEDDQARVRAGALCSEAGGISEREHFSASETRYQSGAKGYNCND